MSVEIVRSLPVESWRRFVEQHPHGNIFHTPEMVQVFARAARHQPLVWAALDPGGQPLVLLLPVEVTIRPGLFGPLTSRAVAYGSVLVSPGAAGQEALAALLRQYQRSVKGHYLFTELRNLADLSELQPTLTGHGFRYQEHLDYLIELNRPAEEVLLGIGPRTRKQIRRGLRQGRVAIEQASRPEQVKTGYQLLRQTYAHAGVPLADGSLFEAAFDLLQPKGMVQFRLAWVGDSCVATSVDLLYKGVIYGWYGGMDRTYSQVVPNELLTWDILRWGSEQGYHLFDWGGAGKPDEAYGVRDFKAKFGGALVSYGRNTCVHAPIRLAISRAAYRLYRRARAQKGVRRRKQPSRAGGLDGEKGCP